jgi:hypothetical protein
MSLPPERSSTNSSRCDHRRYIERSQPSTDSRTMVQMGSAVDWFARVVGLAGLTVAAGSLGWQFAEWVLSGSRVRVEPARIGIAATQPEPMETIGFTVRNIGRSVTTVELWGFMLRDNRPMVFWTKPDRWDNPALPHRIEPGTGATWTIPLAWVEQALAQEGLGSVALRPQVSLGTGRKKSARKALTLPVREWHPE